MVKPLAATSQDELEDEPIDDASKEVASSLPSSIEVQTSCQPTTIKKEMSTSTLNDASEEAIKDLSEKDTDSKVVPAPTSFAVSTEDHKDGVPTAESGVYKVPGYQVCWGRISG